MSCSLPRSPTPRAELTCPFLGALLQVHDSTEHDANFNQVEAKTQNTAQVVAFAKDDDDDKVTLFPSSPSSSERSLSLD